jgi:hypothetical protein
MTDYRHINLNAVLVLLALVFGCGVYLGYQIKQCPEIASTSVVYRDSVVEKKHEPIVIGGQPKLIQTRKYKERLQPNKERTKNNAEHSDSNHVAEISNKVLENKECLDTNIYFKETHEPDSFRIITYAEVTNNEMIKLKVTFENLLKERIRIIERTNTIENKQSLVKVYLGAYANVAIQSKAIASYRGGIGLDAIISDKHLIGLQGGVNSFLQPEIGIRFSEKIRFKK